jgi:two-component system, sensor histidine kinase and response regulator
MESISIQEKSIYILLVENNPADVYIIKDFLKAAGSMFSVTHSSTLKEALKEMDEHEFDVVLLDLGLSDSFGLETLKKILASKIKTPILVMTGLNDEDVALAAVKEGAQDYLVKNNITSENIIRAIRYSIERKKIQEIKEKNTRQFSILSSATVAINECEDIPSIYGVVCENISVLLPGIIACSIDGEDNVHVEDDHYWVQSFLDEIQKKQWDFIYNGKLHPLSAEVFNGISLKSNSLKTDVGFNQYSYAIGFSRGDKHYGGVFIFSKLPIENNDMDIIGAISNQASLNIHRRFIERTLKESENRYKVLFGEATNAKEALQRLNEELDLRVQLRTQEIAKINTLLQLELEEHHRTLEKLKKSASHLKDLNAMKDKFFGIIAHDLKNPFTALLGSSELLMNYTDDYDSDNIKRISTSLYNSAKTGYALLENLLEWSRAQTGNINFKPERVNIRKLVDENISNMSVYFENKKIELRSEIAEDTEAMADRNMLNTVLRNLLNNAVKFTHKNGKILVTATKCNGDLIITVKDNGIGIPPTEIDKLFRVDAHYTNLGTAQERGTGLGLLLCKEFIEKHGGRIWVESSDGKGSEFKFTIPCAEAHIKPSETDNSPAFIVKER